MSNLDAILKQYDKNTSNASKKMTSEERLKQYFTTFLPDGVNNLVKKVRILPVGENESPFVEVMGHKSQVGTQWRTFICPKHEADEECPFCQAREELLATGLESDKELAKKYSARKMYVVKVIDRAHEDYGPKFWRFNHDYRKTGIFDKIIGVLGGIADSAAPDITNAENGRDLIITLNRDSNGRPQVSSIVQGDPTPLSNDAETVQTWMKNDRTWKDVYAVKPYDFLKIIVTGGEPAWKRFDKEDENGNKGMWIDKTAVDATTDSDEEVEELTIGSGTEAKADETPTDTATESVASDESDTTAKTAEADDDLPF